MAKGKSTRPVRIWDYLNRTNVLGGIAMTIIGGLTYFNITWGPSDKSMQLTVYVHGPESRQQILLEHTGRLVVDFDNDRRVALIGENGRTNFGEIPEKFKNQHIGIGLEADRFTTRFPKKQYKLDGKPIYLEIKRDDSLGIIAGSVVNGSGAAFIAGALVLIGSDTSTTTNAHGIFKMKLPPRMQVPDARTPYSLTITKDGFQTITENYYPLSGHIKIRMEK